MKNKNQQPKKNYTLQIPEAVVNRMWYLRDISKKNIDPNPLINKFILEMLEHYEKKYKIGKDDHKEALKCNKCSSFMKKVTYKEEKYWACSAYPKCKNMKKIKGD
jgi:hypothetical protein